MQNTTNYNLNKPDQTDQYNIEHFNENSDILDSNLKRIDDEIVDVNDLANGKLDKASTSDIIYGTDSSGNQISRPFLKSNTNINGNDEVLVSEKFVQEFVKGIFSNSNYWISVPNINVAGDRDWRTLVGFNVLKYEGTQSAINYGLPVNSCFVVSSVENNGRRGFAVCVRWSRGDDSIGESWVNTLHDDTASWNWSGWKRTSFKTVIEMFVNGHYPLIPNNVVWDKIGFNLVEYNNADVTTYNLPYKNVFVISLKYSNTYGIAFAVYWGINKNLQKIWVNTINQSTQSWNGWTTAIGGITVPIGTVSAFAGTTLPIGYLWCNGQEVSRTTYSELFSVIGTTFGTGDGSTTFNVPNLNDNRFIEGSTTIGTNKNAGLPNITGTFASFGYYYSTVFQNPSGAFDVGGKISRDDEGTNDSNTAVQFKFDASKSNSIYGGSTTVQPKSLTLKYMIKY